MSSTAPTPQTSPQAMIDAAKASSLAYNETNWTAVRSAITPNCTYDEIATQRRVQGVDEVIRCWQGWAEAFPDSKCTFHNALASGNTVCLELTWRGTHTGTLETDNGSIPATNQSIEIRACQVCEMAEGKAESMRHYFDMATMMRQLGVNR